MPSSDQKVNHVPWWRVNVKPRPPEAQRPSPPAPPWLRCEGECSHWWWQRQDGPCAAAAAEWSLFFPDVTQCEEESGPPTHTAVERQWRHCIKMMVVSFKKQDINAEIDSRLTRALASTIAPFLRRHRTTSTWPALAAMCKAVSPRWSHDKEGRRQKNQFRNIFHHNWISFKVTRYFWHAPAFVHKRFSLLTMLLTSGEAPFCSSSRTMFRWPMKAATWMGVNPD